MIYVYNQTQNPQWTIKQAGKDGAIQLLNSTTIDTLGIRLLADTANFNLEDLATVNNYNELFKVYDGPTQIQYGHYNNEPRLSDRAGSVDTDLLLLTLDTMGKEVLSVFNKWATVHFARYDRVNNALHFILHLQKNRPLPTFRVLFKNSDEGACDYEQFGIRYSDRRLTYELITRQFNEDEIPARGQRGYIKTDKQSMRSVLRTYRPSRSTYIVVPEQSLSQSDIDVVKHAYNMNERNSRFISMDELKGGLDTTAAITAVTFAITDAQMKQFQQDNEKFLKDVFHTDLRALRYVYVISPAGETHIVKRP